MSIKPIVMTSAQREALLAKEIKSAQATPMSTSNRQRPTARERLDRFAQRFGDGIRRR
ncbi:MAG: hypothetical protein FWE04_03640 [Oscillospiraceae bacterium]|nr:hypothetical protein [Oscillospiraceae bacterium]